MNKKIGLFSPYFVKFPNYFRLWIKSVAINPEIQFILITDQNLTATLPSNLRVIKKEFKDIQRLIRNKFNKLDISLDSPYKLCDFRPAYGYIFDNLIEKYGLDYWGFCDPDVIWGRISEFLKKKSFYEKNYDKVGYLGPFQFFSDKEKMLFTKIIDDEKFRNYKYVFTHKYAYHFDEEISIGLIAKKKNLNILSFEDEPPYADILINSYQFYTYKNASDFSLPRYFNWNEQYGLTQGIYDGCIYKMTPKIYVHLRKRNMDVKINHFSKEYYIIPNEFVSTDQFHQIDLSKTLQDQFYLDFYVNKIEKLIKKFSIGQIKHTYHFQKLLNSYYRGKND